MCVCVRVCVKGHVKTLYSGMDITYSSSDPNVEDGWNLDEVHRQAFYGEVEGGMGVVGEGSGCGSEDQFREEGVVAAAT